MYGTFFEREEPGMKRGMLLCVALLIVVISGLTACNTVRGVGKDIESGGKAIQRATH
jgi:entericidin B